MTNLVNGIGRNLILNSDITPTEIVTPASFEGLTEYLGNFQGKDNVWKITNPPNYFAYHIRGNNPVFEIGSIYTFSIDVWAEGEPYVDKIYLTPRSGSYRILNEKIVTGRWNRVSMTTREIVEVEDVRSPHFDFRGYEVVYISFYPKLEKGTIATPYQQAPEDMMFPLTWGHIQE